MTALFTLWCWRERTERERERVLVGYIWFERGGRAALVCLGIKYWIATDAAVVVVCMHGVKLSTTKVVFIAAILQTVEEDRHFD